MTIEKKYQAKHQHLAGSLISASEKGYINFRFAEAKHLEYDIAHNGRSQHHIDLVATILAHMKANGIEKAGPAMVDMGLLESMDKDAILEGWGRYGRWLNLRAIGQEMLRIQEKEASTGEYGCTARQVATAVIDAKGFEYEDDPFDTREDDIEEMEPLVQETLDRMNPDDRPALIDELNAEPLAA